MLLGADALEGSLIISFDMYSYPMSGHYYPDVHVGKLRYRVSIFPSFEQLIASRVRILGSWYNSCTMV